MVGFGCEGNFRYWTHWSIMDARRLGENVIDDSLARARFLAMNFSLIDFFFWSFLAAAAFSKVLLGEVDLSTCDGLFYDTCICSEAFGRGCFRTR